MLFHLGYRNAYLPIVFLLNTDKGTSEVGCRMSESKLDEFPVVLVMDVVLFFLERHVNS